jgi:hypothetical protein
MARDVKWVESDSELKDRMNPRTIYAPTELDSDLLHAGSWGRIESKSGSKESVYQ